MTTLPTPMNLTSFALALVASGAMLGLAAGPAEAATETLTFHSSELATPAGRAQLETRVRYAAERVCGRGGVDWRNLREQADYRACVAQATAKAREDVAALRSETMLAAR
ncbi:UrcA family protein [Sandaracinobacter sp. RS1-74]|uniref:UrcA family protein n=1 Tax=Sandaracinobacteroides sayramensis TaxID=2913411 RepID=UPI001EDBE0A6|nr:UrcA family protein [Sandaracinobacteroides sayramensis]MCG2841747.1 UrcA family protein [Sandaracinobacteroides sayramensis]